MNARLGWITVCLLVLSGCPVGLGERCAGSDECQGGLTCRLVDADGPGLCDYPLRAEGEPCTTDRECEASLTCSNHFTANQRYGTCVQKRAATEACFVNRDCLSGVCQGATTEALGVCQ
ncbi:MAG: hypothetical protein M3Y59_13265 [Myxococcota bacterium]|nr:hypothetical protein [Myxococcota bacterium]